MTLSHFNFDRCTTNLLVLQGAHLHALFFHALALLLQLLDSLLIFGPDALVLPGQQSPAKPEHDTQTAEGGLDMAEAGCDIARMLKPASV